MLQELCDGSLYFASPASFNDPLDTSPSFLDDLDVQGKQALLAALHRQQHSTLDPEIRLEQLRYLSTEYDDDLRKQDFDRLLCNDIENLFLKEVRTVGIVSFAEDWSCPLMWSHYADQHAGICLGFSTKDHVALNLGKVRYESDRSIHLSDLAAWKLSQNKGARSTVLQTTLLSKASAWSYERE